MRLTIESWQSRFRAVTCHEVERVDLSRGVAQPNKRRTYLPDNAMAPVLLLALLTAIGLLHADLVTASCELDCYQNCNPCRSKPWTSTPAFYPVTPAASVTFNEVGGICQCTAVCVGGCYGAGPSVTQVRTCAHSVLRYYYGRLAAHTCLKLTFHHTRPVDHDRFILAFKTRVRVRCDTDTLEIYATCAATCARATERLQLGTAQ